MRAAAAQAERGEKSAPARRPPAPAARRAGPRRRAEPLNQAVKPIARGAPATLADDVDDVRRGHGSRCGAWQPSRRAGWRVSTSIPSSSFTAPLNVIDRRAISVSTQSRYKSSRCDLPLGATMNWKATPALVAAATLLAACQTTDFLPGGPVMGWAKSGTSRAQRRLAYDDCVLKATAVAQVPYSGYPEGADSISTVPRFEPTPEFHIENSSRGLWRQRRSVRGASWPSPRGRWGRIIQSRSLLQIKPLYPATLRNGLHGKERLCFDQD